LAVALFSYFYKFLVNFTNPLFSVSLGRAVDLFYTNILDKTADISLAEARFVTSVGLLLSRDGMRRLSILLNNGNHKEGSATNLYEARKKHTF